MNDTPIPNKKTMVLLILDGWGHSDAIKHNAIKAANSPNWDRIWDNNAKTLISGSGLDVGLPEGQMGNSEVGHITLGAGRPVFQSLTRIDKDIAEKTFQQNASYCAAIDAAISQNKAVHIMGLLSAGGVHSHQQHIFSIIRLAAARGAKQIYLHAFADGRDTAPRCISNSIQAVEALFAKLQVGRVASVVGRYYAMDRDNRWDRVSQAYNLITHGEAPNHAKTAALAVEDAYARGENDEFISATRIGNVAAVEDGDALIFMNFRADRAREITRAFVDETFTEFDRGTAVNCHFVMTCEYAADIEAAVAYPPASLKNSLGDYLSQQHKTQLRIAETEKYAHVTFFFSGGQEALYQGEQRILVASPKVATYDLQPEMSAPEVTEKLCNAIKSSEFDVIICNFANGDMVGHTGIFSAAVKAVEALDECLGKIESVILEANGQCLITADHGNIECMQDHTTGQPLTSHTSEPVPLVYVGHRDINLRAGTLADVAPTLLSLMGIDKPSEMTGNNLVD